MENKYDLTALAGAALAIAGGAVLLDFAFQYSKVSFFSRLAPLEAAGIAVNSTAIVVLPAVLALMVLKALHWALRGVKHSEALLRSLALYAFSAAFTALAFAHADTWAYSTFGRDILDLPAYANRILLVLLFGASVLLFVKAGDKVYVFFTSHRKAAMGLYAALILLALAFTFNNLHARAGRNESSAPAGAGAKAVGNVGEERPLPNIVLFSTDGIEPGHMSAYGYARDTTPNLRKLVQSSTLYSRAYSNMSHSRGSLSSILTGKSPATTKVLYPPDILKWEDSFEHLPGILSSLGYYTLALADSVHLAPREYNLRLAFDKENGTRTSLGTGFPALTRLKKTFTIELYFVTAMVQRVTGRLSHMAGLSVKQRAAFVGDLNPHHYSSEDALFEWLLKEIKASERPVFAHIHMLRTHGPIFSGLLKKFTGQRTQEEPNDPEFFDDAIYTADYYFGLLLGALKETGKFKNTLIVFHTDHGLWERVHKPLPLVVHLPGQTEGKQVDTAVQYLDIAPSVLAYLGVDVPQWMEGQPTLGHVGKDPQAGRPIYMFETRVAFDAKASTLTRSPLGPPLYGLSSASMLKRGLLYTMDFYTGREQLFDVSEDPFILKDARARAERPIYRRDVLSYLMDKGIDTSVIEIRKDKEDDR